MFRQTENDARSCCQSPTTNAVKKIVSRKVRWRAVVGIVPACSSVEYKDEEGTDSWTVIIHVCTCHVLPDIGLIYIGHIYCVLVKGAKIFKPAKCFILLHKSVSGVLLSPYCL